MSSLRGSARRRLLILLALTTAPVTLGAGVPPLGADGWHSWRVEAVAAAPDWCCLPGPGSADDGGRCSLDAGTRSYGSARASGPAPADMRIYVRIEDGAAVDVQAFSAACQVSATQGIEDHGNVEADESARWLGALLTAGELAGDGAMAALAVHAGDGAAGLLRRMAADGPGRGLRKDAVFWIGQVRAREMRADLRTLMFDDADAKIREHAAFSWSQSDLEDRGDALVELAQRDPDVQVRGQAWFWLAQTGDPRTETAVLAALRAEPSARVREQAVFALAQLGEEWAAAALIAVVENRALAAGERERALFWLAQDSSARALEYLAGVLE